MQIFQPSETPRIIIPTWVVCVVHFGLANLVLMLLSFPVTGQPQDVACLGCVQTTVRPTERPLSLAILDFGDSALGRLAADKLAINLKRETGVVVLDRDQVRAAARGAGYEGSMSLTLGEARDLGAALG